MHDPDVLAFDIRWLGLDIWHSEPGGHDSATICGHMPRSTRARVWWTMRHSNHLRYRWWPAVNIRRWIVDRCDHCGRRFRWREERHSYQGTDRVWHDVCMSLRHVQGHLDDLTRYVQGTADWNTRWRAEYRLKGLETPSEAESGQRGQDEGET